MHAKHQIYLHSFNLVNILWIDCSSISWLRTRLEILVSSSRWWWILRRIKIIRSLIQTKTTITIMMTSKWIFPRIAPRNQRMRLVLAKFQTMVNKSEGKAYSTSRRVPSHESWPQILILFQSMGESQVALRTRFNSSRSKTMNLMTSTKSPNSLKKNMT